ncbi:hypothetical protein IWZ03DRAFT_188544 [Phyllosticta citriasiana]|uniref:Uncharacterized protein n=1 Tax=Phyllosticta citriasiana TaxID=595635 RepID=A0ABR1KPW5_9PEZI
MPSALCILRVGGVSTDGRDVLAGLMATPGPAAPITGRHGSRQPNNEPPPALCASIVEISGRSSNLDALFHSQPTHVSTPLFYSNLSTYCAWLPSFLSFAIRASPLARRPAPPRCCLPNLQASSSPPCASTPLSPRRIDALLPSSRAVHISRLCANHTQPLPGRIMVPVDASAAGRAHPRTSTASPRPFSLSTRPPTNPITAMIQPFNLSRCPDCVLTHQLLQSWTAQVA